MAEQKKEPTAAAHSQVQLLRSPLSVVKMDVSELRNYTERLNDFLKAPGPAAIKICECCINIS